MRNKWYIIFCCFIVLAGCTKNKKETGKTDNTVNTQWKFDREIKLDSISPIGIFAEGNFLWLSDVANNRIVKIDLNGKILKQYRGFQRPMHIATQNGKIYVPEYTSDSLKIIDSDKVSNYLLKEKPDAIGGVSIHGNMVAIADFYNHRIILQEDDKVTIIGKEGHQDGALYYPTDVELKGDLIYVADAYNNRVQVFDLKGNYVKMIGWNENIKVATGLKVTNTQVIIADFEGNRILMYDHDGKLIQILNDKFNQPTDIEVADNKMFVVNYQGKSIAIFKK